MAKLIATHQPPHDPAAFDTHCFDTHASLAKTIFGLLSYEATRGDVIGMASGYSASLWAILEFASIPAARKAMASFMAQATASALSNFAGAGEELMMSGAQIV